MRFCLTVAAAGRIIKTDKEAGEHSMKSMQKSAPQGALPPWGAILCLLALAMTVKPLADIVASYARSDRHREGALGARLNCCKIFGQFSVIFVNIL